jgi:hypothetical protein
MKTLQRLHLGGCATVFHCLCKWPHNYNGSHAMQVGSAADSFCLYRAEYGNCPGSVVAVLQRGIAASYLVRWLTQKERNKLRGLSPLANCTDRATAACRRS